MPLPPALAQAVRGHLEQARAGARYLTRPAEWASERLGDHLWSTQRDIAQSIVDNPRTAVKACHGPGKALSLDTPLPTPTGWTTMGDVQPGDRVLDESGAPVVVVGKSETWSMPAYRVEFDDGSELIANGPHEWDAIDLRHRPRNIGDWRDQWGACVRVTTEGMLATLRQSGQLRWRIPVARPLDLPDASLPIHPYVLGVWLGDGTSIRAEVTCHDDDREIMDRVASLGENVRRRLNAAYAWTMAGALPDRPLLLHRLRDLNLLSNKHIPVEYLRASREQRMELLRGLMDTDGFNAKGGHVGLDLADGVLAADVAELVVSLGWKVRVDEQPSKYYGRVVGTRHRINFTADESPFFLTRKRVSWKPRGAQRSRHTQRTVKNITPMGVVPTACIEVDSPRHLYLAGRGMVPTHNSFLASRIALWWIDAHPPGEAIVVSTAPTYAQVHAILWEEIRKGHRKGGLPGVVLKSDEWQNDAGDIVGFGRKPADTDEHGFQGIHRRYVLVIIDEACGVPKQLFTAAEAIATNDDCRILVIGNPDDPNTEFGAVCKPGSGYNVIGISAFDTPNFTGEDVPDYLSKLLISPGWVEDKRRRWGVDSPLWRSKVEGEFPEVGENTLINPAWITAAQERTLQPSAPHTLGVDVARFGSDLTVIAHRQGAHVRIIKTMSHVPTTETAGEVKVLQRDFAYPVAQVDGVGVGGGVVDILREDGHPVTDMQAGAAGSAEIDPETGLTIHRYQNARAEWYWHLRLLFQNGQIDIDPNDDELASQLGSLRWSLNSKGRIQIESKDDMKARGMPSPDRADALMLAFGHRPEIITRTTNLVDELIGDDFSILNY